jgi:hypothetical protein
MNLSSLLKFGYRGALPLLVFWYLVESFVYIGSCNLIGQYVVFSSFPRLNVDDSRSKKGLGKKNTLSTSFFLNDTAVVLYIISDSSIYLVAVTNFALRTEFWTRELFLLDLDRTI